MTAPRSDRDGVTQAINALTEAGWTVVEVEGQAGLKIIDARTLWRPSLRTCR